MPCITQLKNGINGHTICGTFTKKKKVYNRSALGLIIEDFTLSDELWISFQVSGSSKDLTGTFSDQLVTTDLTTSSPEKKSTRYVLEHNLVIAKSPA